MTSSKPQVGMQMPAFELPLVGGGSITLGQPGNGRDWQVVIVYRGKHCPKCHDYARKLEEELPLFAEAGCDVVLISGDPEDKAQAFVDDTGTSVPVGYGLEISQMQELGLYVSDPRSPQETDRPFPEPGVFVVNDKGNVQIADVSNAPFSRPDLGNLARGIKFIREKNYPIRGTHGS